MARVFRSRGSGTVLENRKEPRLGDAVALSFLGRVKPRDPDVGEYANYDVVHKKPAPGPRIVEEPEEPPEELPMGPADAGAAGSRGSAPADPLLTAARLVVRGVNVVPLKPNDKRPAIDWKPLQVGHLIDRDSDWLDRWLMSWWKPRRKAIAGAVSRIVVVDVDDDGARVSSSERADGPRR
jgi:hypothetical protein